MFRGLESRRPVGRQRRRRWCCQSVFEMIDDITSFLLSPSLVTSKRAYATMASFLFDLEPSICSVLFLCVITYISFSCAYRLKTSKEAFPPSNIFSFRYTATFFSSFRSCHIIPSRLPPFSLHFFPSNSTDFLVSLATVFLCT